MGAHRRVGRDLTHNVGVLLGIPVGGVQRTAGLGRLGGTAVDVSPAAAPIGFWAASCLGQISGPKTVRLRKCATHYKGAVIETYM